MTTSTQTPAAAASGSIRLRYVELCKFRRLGKVQLDLDPKTTILVGANNSGKTSILTALRNFLSETPAFGAFDISLWAENPAEALNFARNKSDWFTAEEIVEIA